MNKFSKLSPKKQQDARDILEECLRQEITNYLAEYVEVGGKRTIPDTYIEEEVKRIADTTIQEEEGGWWDKLLDARELDWFCELIGEFGTLYKRYKLYDAYKGVEADIPSEDNVSGP